MEDAICLTPTRRLSKRLLDERGFAQEALAWAAPPISAWQDFVHQLFEALSCITGQSRIILSPWQAKCVWERIISEQTPDIVALTVSEWAHLAQSAWSLCQQACQPLENVPCPDSITQTFILWAQAYVDECDKHRWIDEDGMLTFLSALLKEYGHSSDLLRVLPKSLELYGFDEKTPQLKEFLECLSHLGVAISEAEYASLKGRSYQIGFVSPEEEWRQAARWAKLQFEKDPKGPIGVVIPSLSADRALIESLFDEVFHPELSTRPGDKGIRTYNMSAPLSLGSVAVLDVAKEILRSHCYSTPIDPYYHQSPYIRGAASEFYARVRTASIQIPHESLEGIITVDPEMGAKLEAMAESLGLSVDPLAIEKSLRSKTPQWDFMEYCAKSLTLRWPKEATCLDWWLYFEQVLSVYLWPGERQLTSTEYQTVARFKNLKDTYAQGAQILSLITRQQGFDILNKLLFDVTFSPESHQEPVQVLGVLEATGQHFSALWVSGMTEEAWPPRPSPHPLLSARWQRELDFPHASVERELAFTQKIIERLKMSAPEIVFSYHERNEDAVCAPSYFIRELPLLNRIVIDTIVYEREQKKFEDRLSASAGAPLETPPHVTPVEYVGLSPVQWVVQDRLKGAQRRLKLQAECPFKGFFITRLGLEQEQKKVLGNTAPARGELIHGVLAAVWTILKNSDELHHAYHGTSLEGLVRQVIDAVCRDAKGVPSLEEKIFWGLEKQALLKTVMKWLTYETRRSPFRVVDCESSKVVRLGDLPIHLRIDRVDEDEAGRRCVIDYKTGLSSLSGWFDLRLTEPQMALYYLALDQEVSGLFYAQVNANQTKFIGIAAPKCFEDLSPSLLSKVSQDVAQWENLGDYWGAKLMVLVNEFRQGVNHPQPAHGQQTCNRCHLAHLCHYQEETLSE